MRNSIFVMLVCAFAIFGMSTDLAAKDGPIVVKNGSGVSEFNLVFVRSNWKEILTDCALNCVQSSEEFSLLRSLIEAEPNETAKLVFQDSRQLGNELYKTDKEVGAVVYLNQDLLWTDAERTEPYDQGAAAELLTRIYSLHVQGDLRVTKSLAAKMAYLVKTKVQRSKFLFGNISVVEAVLWKLKSDDQLILQTFSGDSFYVTAAVLKQLECAAYKPTVRFFNPRWMALSELNHQEKTLYARLQAGLKWSCGIEEFLSSVDVTIVLKTEKEISDFQKKPEGELIFVKDSEQVEVDE